MRLRIGPTSSGSSEMELDKVRRVLSSQVSQLLGSKLLPANWPVFSLAGNIFKVFFFFF